MSSESHKVSKIRIIDPTSNEVLYEFNIDEANQAYEMAATLEQAGAHIELITPSVTRTLLDALGKTDEECSVYDETLLAEIDEHNH